MNRSNLTGRQILIVEDEFYIASDLKRALSASGAVPVGPAACVADAIALIESGPVDGALLDVNLEGEFSYPVADRLAERGVPFLFLTGYDGWALPDAYQDAVRIAKPFATANVLQEAAALFPDRSAPA